MKYLLAVFIIIGSISLGTIAQVKIHTAQKQNQQELTCVYEMINSGHDRINIARGNGKCWFQPNGYYL